jgi:hypothetical protein
MYHSWEPSSNVEESCKEMLTRFWNHVGLDNDGTYPTMETQSKLLTVYTPRLLPGRCCPSKAALD